MTTQQNALASTTENQTVPLAFINATVVDALHPAGHTADVVIADGKILEVAKGAAAKHRDLEQINAEGLVLTTGLVDLHTHFSEPGDETAETVDQTCNAAVAGGFTTVLAQPDTFPVIDDPAVVHHMRWLARNAKCNVEVAGAVTIGQAGKRLAPLGELSDAGVALVTDGHRGIQNSRLFRRALEYSAPLGLVIAQTAHNDELAGDYQMHEGEVSSLLGLAGTPTAAELIRVMRDYTLAATVGARLHFQKLSTKASIEFLKTNPQNARWAGAIADRSTADLPKAKKAAFAAGQGFAISAELTAHHLVFDHSELHGYNPDFKVEPPLREPVDRQALIAALSDDNLAIAVVSDHKAHTIDRKERPFDQCEAGTTGLETALSLALSSGIELHHVLAALSWKPAEILGLGTSLQRSVSAGATADLVLIDPASTWRVDLADMATAGANSIASGKELPAVIKATVVQGKLVYESSLERRK